MARSRFISFILLALLWTGCVYPTERSGELSVDMDPIPDFRQGEFDTLTARVVTATGVAVPDAPIKFQSSNPGVLAITPEGELQATGSGISVVTARAIGFENAGVAEQLVTVKKSVAIDSIRPISVQYGQTVQFFGVGLNPDSVFFISLGDEIPPDNFTWNPVDPNKPNGFGVLDVWVAPLTPQIAPVVVVAPDGALVASDTLRVQRRDIYEPNDTNPRDLGPIPGIFFNPALAFEQRLREEIGADLYRFNQTSVGDRTVFVRSDQLSNEAFRVILAQRGVLGHDTEGDLVVTNPGWAFGGPGLQVCNGVGFEFPFLPGPVVVAAFKNLPIGTYDIVAPYGAPGRYEMAIVNAYVSSRAVDHDEENDICGLAKPLVPDEIKQLTIDNPYDPDWFTYTPATNVLAVFSTTITGQGGFLDPDLDVFVFHETQDTVVAVAQSSTAGDNATDVASVILRAGEKYLILVTDYAGVPTRYELALTTTPAPAATPDFTSDRVTKIINGLRLFSGKVAGRR